MRDSRFLVFYPLHYNTYSIGYLVMDGISEAAKLNLHKSIFSFLEIAIENVRKRGLLHQLNGVLDNLYVHDALTGLYNRFGYARYGRESCERLMNEDGGARIVFIDMDDMKGINDRLGHEYGDAAICATAQILKDIATPRDFLMRYGGDEFLMIAARGKGDLAGKIEHAVAEYNRTADVPFTLCLSIGITDSQNRDADALDQLVQAADAQMYKCKSLHKQHRR
jgi:diguanylate cyclase (GGDEF)-like protein